MEFISTPKQYIDAVEQAAASVGQSVSFLWWLTLGDSIGFGYPQAVTLDLSVIRLNLGFYLELNVAQMIGLIAAVAAYFAWGRKL